MFCPKCNEELVNVKGEFTCLKGQMGLSKNLERGLMECFVYTTRKPKEFSFSFLVGGKWFCPGCGVLTKEKDGFVQCPQCNLSLNEFIHTLVELHSHLEEGQKSWD